MAYPEGFLWGAASASAQVEGAWNEGGKCPSIWDVAEGHVRGGDDCHVACDHYHRYREDVALMKELGLKAYRFSVSWCRVMPEDGRVNREGLAFYSDLVDALLAAGIEPMVTLYHWDMPLWMHEMGGWGTEEIVGRFLEYARAVVEALSDRVRWWMPFNEPQCFLGLGYLTGIHAPFLKNTPGFERYVRSFLLAHGRTVRMIRETAKLPPKIGAVMAIGTYVPDGPEPEDIEAARERTFGPGRGEDWNSLYLDPIALGTPSPRMENHLSEEDLAICSEPIDFVGLNVYQPSNPDVDPGRYHAERFPKTMLGWSVDGRCLYWSIRFFRERYRLPVMVTENGMARPDTVSPDGHVHDPERIRFLEEYLGDMRRAVEEGIPVLGYLHWSILDNFEWAEGYGPRFGLVHVDYDTQKRTVKDSALFYADYIRAHS